MEPFAEADDAPAGAATSMRQLLVPRSRAAKDGQENRRVSVVCKLAASASEWAFRGIIRPFSSVHAGTGKSRFGGCPGFHVGMACWLPSHPSFNPDRSGGIVHGRNS
jgi:hypothetical protein